MSETPTMNRSSLSHQLGRLSPRFWVLAVFLAFAFLIGGGSRSDIESLMILRPVSAVVLAYALSGLSARDIRGHWVPLLVAILAVLLCMVQLVPLPPSIWQALPGRDLIVDIDHAAELGAIWRPVNMTPQDGWNALFALLPPLAALILAVQLRRDEKWALIPVIVGVALFSGIIAVLQLGGPSNGPLYFYRITNLGAAVGLFANRNHQAVFLATIIPMLAVSASAHVRFPIDQRLRGLLALAIGLFIVPLILVTGSRAGLIVSVLGLIGAAILFGLPRQKRLAHEATAMPKLWLALLGVVILISAGATMWLGRAVALERLFAEPAGIELRYRAWAPMWEMTLRYFPIGSGFGSFPDLFAVHEPYALLSPTTFRHAHNDWLELLFTGGIPALLLLSVAVVAVIVTVVRSFGPGHEKTIVLMTRLGLCVIGMLAVASAVDYPLRTPSISCLFAVAVAWASSLSSSRIGPEKV